MSDNTDVVFRKTSFVDYPGHLASAMFFAGCNLRCPWCQNGALALAREDATAFTPLREARLALSRRRGIITGVVLSGGEPTLVPTLGAIVAGVKADGFLCKLDTNGMRPDALAALFANSATTPDFVALDLKVAPERYTALCGAPSDAAARLAESARLIRMADCEVEMRSLVLPDGLFGEEDIAALLPLAGTALWRFRAFRPGSCLDPRWNAAEAPSDKTVAAIVSTAAKLGANAR